MKRIFYAIQAGKEPKYLKLGNNFSLNENLLDATLFETEEVAEMYLDIPCLKFAKNVKVIMVEARYKIIN